MNKLAIPLQTIATLCLICFCGSHLNKIQETLTLGLRNSSQKSQSQVRSANEARIRDLITRLFAETKEDKIQLKNQILAAANASSNDREIVIHELMRASEEHNSKNGPLLKPSDFQIWTISCEIFANLREVESIDLLVKYIYWGDALSDLGGAHRPAVYALSEMGPVAIPKLAEALLHRADPYSGCLIASCLAEIGGPDAKKALETARISETSKDVVDCINTAISTTQCVDQLSTKSSSASDQPGR